MRSLVKEYGIVIVAIIAGMSIFVVVSFLLGDGGFRFTYKTYSVYDQDGLKAGTTNINDYFGIYEGTVSVPYFVDTIASSGEEPVLINIPSTFDAEFSKKMDMFSTFCDGVSVRYEGFASDIYDYSVIVVKYSPRMLEDTDVRQLPFETESYVATDKYGNPLIDSDGKTVVTDRLVYDTEVYRNDEVTDVDIDFSVPSIFKVLYRYVDSSGLKCEHTRLYLNDTISESDRLGL